MHMVTRFDESAMGTPPRYAEHSEGYSRVPLADHSIADCTHMGFGEAVAIRLAAEGVNLVLPASDLASYIKAEALVVDGGSSVSAR